MIMLVCVEGSEDGEGGRLRVVRGTVEGSEGGRLRMVRVEG